MEASGLGFVGLLVVSNHPDLLAVPASELSVVDADRFGGLTAYDTTATALGVTRRAAVTHSPTFHAAQARGFAQTLAKAGRRLDELAARLPAANPQGPPGRGGEISAILEPRWVGWVIAVSLTGEQPADLRLTWEIDQTARDRLAGCSAYGGS
ncbi:MAG: hypothetical protein ACRDYA_22425 [Egibacteraceae bacterium]